MHILFCDNAIDQFLNFRGDVAEYFHSKGDEVSVAIPAVSLEKFDKTKIPDYLTVYPVDMKRNGTNPLSDLKYYLELRKLFTKVKPDIVFLYTVKPNIYGAIAAHSLKIPVVAMVAGLGYVFSNHGITARLARALYKFGLKKADKVIVLNQSNLDTLRDTNFVSEGKLVLFENGEGVNLDQYRFANDNYDNIRFLMVGRVLYDKGYSEFVEASRKVHEKYPDIKTELLGPIETESPMGVPPDVVERDSSSGAIKYLGQTHDVTPYISAPGTATILVSSYKEGFNRSLMEACAMGRICITSNVPGCKEIVDNGVNGLIVPPKDPNALARAMISLIEKSPSERRKMGNESHKRAVSRFDIRHVFRKYDEILESLGLVGGGIKH